MTSAFFILSVVASCAALNLPSNPFNKIKDVKADLISDILLTHVVPTQFLEKVPLQGQLEFYSIFLNKDIKKGDKHTQLTAWSEKYNVPQEFAESYQTYNDNMHEVNNTLFDLTTERLPEATNEIFDIVRRTDSTLEEDANDIKNTTVALLIDASAALTKSANLMGFNVAPGLIPYAFAKVTGQFGEIDPTILFNFIDVNRLFDLSFLKKVSPSEAKKFNAILTNLKTPKSEIVKQIDAWAAKNGVTSEVEKSKAAYQQKLTQAQGLINGFGSRLEEQYLPKLGDVFASQEISQGETADQLSVVIGQIKEDYLKTHIQFVTLVGLKPPFGPPALPTLPKLPGILGKLHF